MKIHTQLFTALMLVLGLSLSAPMLSAAKEKAPAVEVMEVTKTGRKNPKIKISASNSKKLNKALALMQDEKYDESLAVVESILAGAKATPYEKSKGNQLKSNIYYFQDKYPEALLASRAAIAADGLPNIEHVQLKFQAVQLLVQQEKYDEAVAAFKEYEAEAPKIKGDEYVALAGSYYYQDKYPEAIAAIDQALATGEAPKQNWLQIKANSLYSGENFEGTVAYLKELLVKDPTNKQWMSLAVSSYLSLDKYPEATTMLLDAKAKGLLDTEALWTQLHQLYTYQEKYAEAAAVIEEGISKGVLKADAKRLSDLGQNYYTASQELEGKPEAKALLAKAVDAFTRGAAVSADDGTSELWLAQIELFENENSKRARELLLVASKKKLKQPGSAFYYLGVAEHQLGNIPAARAALNEALKYPETKSQATSYMKNLR
jgi:predicted Zn-dependent protease